MAVPAKRERSAARWGASTVGGWGDSCHNKGWYSARGEMRRNLSRAESARYERNGLFFPMDAFSRGKVREQMPVYEPVTMRSSVFAVLGLVLPLLAAGCADTGSSSDNDRHSVFYGGVSGGGLRP